MNTNSGAALILEGGGFRGMFTAGVLDVLQEHGIYQFTSVWGVSAGAINAASYKSKQIGRTMRIMLAFRDDRRFMGVWSLARTGDIAGAEFMYDEIQNRLDPSDDVTFTQNPLRMYAVATDVVLGTAAYLPVRHFPEDVDRVRASASLPPLSRMVEIDGHRYLDGGTADSIPFEVALGLEPLDRPATAGSSSFHVSSDATEQIHEHMMLAAVATPQIEGYLSADRALVVLTRDRTWRHEGRNERLAIRSHRYDDYPYYLRALSTRAERYNACRERLFALEAAEKSRLLVIAPERPVEVGVAEHDGGRLLDLYLQGRQQTERRLPEIQSFLA